MNQPFGLVWILGRGGLVGSAVRRFEQGAVHFIDDQISWSSKIEFERTFLLAVRKFFELASHQKTPWAIYWCAGVGTPNSGREATNLEVVAIELLAQAISDCREGIANRGTVFFSSSAGGIYGGASSSPVHEEMPPSPWTEYGLMKLNLESVLSRAARASGCRLALGRFSNVYGPGQNFGKSQGLITQACISVVTRQPLRIYVPLGTVRNYIFVDDAARVATALTRLVAMEPPSTIIKKLICSDRNLSISAILYEVSRIFGRRPPVVLSSPKRISGHVIDLSMKSNVLKLIEPASFVLPSHGVAQIQRDLMSTVRQGREPLLRSNR